MTRKRNDDKSTEFGLWLREQKKIDSDLGFVTTNIDYLWENYKTNYYMLLEEKRYMTDLTWSQGKQIEKFLTHIHASPEFRGFHLIQFQNTNPEDGNIYLDKKKITRDELINFLRFE